MRIILTLFSLLAFLTIVKAQESDSSSTDIMWTIVDKMPQFPGGEKKLLKFLSKNIKYPVDARDCNCAGTIYLSFIVDKEGNVTKPKVLKTRIVCSDVEQKDKAKCSTCSDQMENEGLRVIKSMPKWEPAVYEGKPVSVQYNLPLKFSLQ